MRHPVPGATRAAFCVLLFLAPMAVVSAAHSGEPDRGPACSCPETGHQPDVSPAAEHETVKLALDASDATATLHAVQIGLTELPDGARFVWRRAHGRLSGVVRPKFSFKNDLGAVCRQLELTLRSGTYTRTIEGIACRDPDGRWALDG